MSQIDILRNSLIDKLYSIENEQVLKAINTLLEESTDTTPMYEFSEEQINELKQSDQQIDQGLVLNHDEVISRAKEWVKKR